MEFNTEVFWVQMHNPSITCMEETMGGLNGNIIGKFQDCDVREDGTRWGKVL